MKELNLNNFNNIYNPFIDLNQRNENLSKIKDASKNYNH